MDNGPIFFGVFVGILAGGTFSAVLGGILLALSSKLEKQWVDAVFNLCVSVVQLLDQSPESPHKRVVERDLARVLRNESEDE